MRSLRDYVFFAYEWDNLPTQFVFVKSQTNPAAVHSPPSAEQVIGSKRENRYIHFASVAYVRWPFPFLDFQDFFQKNLEANNTSFESTKIEHLYSRKKVGVASLWG